MEACNLGSINLSRFVVPGSGKPGIDYRALSRVVVDAVHFLDNTIDMSVYPLPDIEKMVKGNRKIGLGIMGFADALFMLKVPYNSAEALELAENIMGFIQKESCRASRQLASDRGPFQNHSQSIFQSFNHPPRRNATTTTIAPTGTLSAIAGCSSGIEPVFALRYMKNVLDGQRLFEVNPHFEAFAKANGFYSQDVIDHISETGSIGGLKQIPRNIRKVFVTAFDVSPEWHIRMQAAFQKHTDNAVSKTVNLQRNCSVDEVRTIFDLAHDLGCKGVTVYRDGSKAKQVLSLLIDNSIQSVSSQKGGYPPTTMTSGMLKWNASTEHHAMAPIHPIQHPNEDECDCI